jgi:spore coat protein U-like protein
MDGGTAPASTAVGAAGTRAPIVAARAASAGPSSFTLSATVANSYAISATNVAFGTINAGVAYANTSGSVRLTCNKGVSVPSVALNNGANALGTQKRMRRGAERLPYNIDLPTGPAFSACPAPGAGPGGNATNTVAATSLFAATGGTKLITLCVSLPAGNDPLAGNDTDTVRVAATYN